MQFGLILCVILGGVFYHGAYYNHGFLATDEGSAAFIAQRLLAGELPFVDVPLGYGVLWFYPISLLFSVSENDFSAMKIYFHALLLVTGVLGYVFLRRTGVTFWLALTCSAMLIAVPGTPHKAYIPLCMIANMLALSCLDLRRTELAWSRLLILGIAAGLTALIRTEQGIYLVGLILGLLIVHALVNGRTSNGKASAIVRSFALLALGITLTFLPPVIRAQKRGYLSEFSQSYLHSAQQVTRIIMGSDHKQESQSGQSASLHSNSGEKKKASRSTNLARPPLVALAGSGSVRSLAFLTYGSLLALLCVGTSLVYSLLGRRRPSGLFSREDVALPTAAFLIALGGYFPFFFFRPDVPHLSQFMPAYMVIVAVSVDRALKRFGSSEEHSGWRRAALSALLCVLLLPLATYLVRARNDDATGSIARRASAGALFEAENGVRVYVPRARQRNLVALRDLILAHADTDDTVACFPYSPGFNVMSDRATCMYRLYVDDSVLGTSWIDSAIERIRDQKPAVVIINNRAINGTEISRFRNWAAPIMTFLDENYERQGKIGSEHVYVLPEATPGNNLQRNP
jgi:hypothetical protein